ncbi:hypothetical protein STEG23_012954 [Scotinomys teguina]
MPADCITSEFDLCQWLRFKEIEDRNVLSKLQRSSGEFNVLEKTGNDDTGIESVSQDTLRMLSKERFSLFFWKLKSMKCHDMKTSGGSHFMLTHSLPPNLSTMSNGVSHILADTRSRANIESFRFCKSEIAINIKLRTDPRALCLLGLLGSSGQALS